MEVESLKREKDVGKFVQDLSNIPLRLPRLLVVRRCPPGMPTFRNLILPELDLRPISNHSLDRHFTARQRYHNNWYGSPPVWRLYQGISEITGKIDLLGRKCKENMEHTNTVTLFVLPANVRNFAWNQVNCPLLLTGWYLNWTKAQRTLDI